MFEEKTKDIEILHDSRGYIASALQHVHSAWDAFTPHGHILDDIF